MKGALELFDNSTALKHHSTSFGWWVVRQCGDDLLGVQPRNIGLIKKLRLKVPGSDPGRGTRNTNTDGGIPMKSKEQKRIEAEVRQEEYDALTNAEKWARINSRPGVSGKETNRLLEAEEPA